MMMVMTKRSMAMMSTTMKPDRLQQVPCYSGKAANMLLPPSEHISSSSSRQPSMSLSSSRACVLSISTLTSSSSSSLPRKPRTLLTYGRRIAINSCIVYYSSHRGEHCMLRSAAHVLFGCLSEQKLFWQLKKNHVTISSLDFS